MKPDFERLAAYGFTEHSGGYEGSQFFMAGDFRADFQVKTDGSVYSSVVDVMNAEEYAPFYASDRDGPFINSVRQGYLEILQELAEKCFIPLPFLFPQSNRIADWIFCAYGDRPEFLWEKYPGYGVFRNPSSKKWYGVILNISRDKLDKLDGKKGENKNGKSNKEKEEVEILDLSADAEDIPVLLQKQGFYAGYHMNKKSWFSVLLDDTVSDDEIKALIDKSRRGKSTC